MGGTVAGAAVMVAVVAIVLRLFTERDLFGGNLERFKRPLRRFVQRDSGGKA